MKKISLIISLVLIISISISAQKKILNIPDIPGYVTLKCDFHSHTVFSDGQVWPTYRVDEAWKDGLDVLAITDHLEIQPKRNYIPTDHNAAWKIAGNLAKERNLILVHSAEITRSMPPGHFNALFVDDASIIYSEDPLETIKSAIDQGAFIQWNHPGWKSQEADGIPKLYDIHKTLLEKGWLHGIEFFNNNEYYPNILSWCREFKLAVIACSDVHDVIAESYPHITRPMTLVFAESRTVESLKEAMIAARTLAYFNNTLAGPESLLKDIFYASIEISEPYFENERYIWIEVNNNSDIPYKLINGKDGVSKAFTLGANSVTTVRIAKEHSTPLTWDVQNLLIDDSSVLNIELKY